MMSAPQVATKPRIAVQYILDPAKLKTTPGLSDFFARVRKVVRSAGFELREYGPDIDPDVISSNALECSGQYAGFVGITFTGTSARQTAVIGRFGGPVGVWFFPGTPWWSMASAGSGLGYLRDEAREGVGLRVEPIWGDPDDPDTAEMLQRFARAAHTAFAMKREKIGLIGGSYYDVMPASNWHPDVLTASLGPSYAELDISLLERECESVTAAEISGLVRRLRSAGMRVAEDDGSLSAVKASARVSIAIESLQETYSLTGVAVNCYGWPDPDAYTGVLGRCGASGCLKAHALGSTIIGCESDVVQCAQQMMFRHLVGKVPCMADPWKVDTDSGVLTAATCSGPAELAPGAAQASIERGTLMSLYSVGVLGVCFPRIAPGPAMLARIHGRGLDRIAVATGELIGSDSTTIPGRLSLNVRLDDPRGFLSRGAIGNHYTFLPTDDLARDMARLETLCAFMGIEVVRV